VVLCTRIRALFITALHISMIDVPLLLADGFESTSGRRVGPPMACIDATACMVDGTHQYQMETHIIRTTECKLNTASDIIYNTVSDIIYMQLQVSLRYLRRR
jgi:hypothetical protein